MAENNENCLFSDSCINLLLKLSNNFISAFPGKVVFGKCSPIGYKKLQHFQFDIFELNKLYFSIFDTVKFFANNEECVMSNQLILSKYDQNYFFSTKIVLHNNSPSKIVVFGIESTVTSTITYEILMSESELNLFISALVKVIPSALCLNSNELFLFNKASKETATTIKSLKEDFNTTAYIKKIVTQNNLCFSDQLLYNLSIFLNYNCEIILIFHKFQTLIHEQVESDNIALILRKITHGNT